jgi:hypothetical protein
MHCVQYHAVAGSVCKGWGKVVMIHREGRVHESPINGYGSSHARLIS